MQMLIDVNKRRNIIQINMQCASYYAKSFGRTSVVVKFFPFEIIEGFYCTVKFPLFDREEHKKRIQFPGSIRRYLNKKTAPH